MKEVGRQNHGDRTKAEEGPAIEESFAVDLSKIPMELVVQANLQVLSPECDQPPNDHDTLSVKLGRGLKYPKNNGYAKYLASIGYHPKLAGMLAAQIVAEGHRRAETSRRNSQFAAALRRIANPRLRGRKKAAAA